MYKNRQNMQFEWPYSMKWSLKYDVYVAFCIFCDTLIGFIGRFRRLELINKWPKMLKRVTIVYQMATQLYVWVVFGVFSHSNKTNYFCDNNDYISIKKLYIHTHIYFYKQILLNKNYLFIIYISMCIWYIINWTSYNLN